MKFLRTAGLVLAIACNVSAFATEPNWSQWVQNYYQQPQPDQLVPAVYGLSRAGYFESEGQPASAIGFLTAVFAQNPERVPAWLNSFRDLPASHQRLVAAAAWYAGTPAGEARLRQLAKQSSPEVRTEVNGLLASKAPALRNEPVLSESSLNLQWGAFLATGEQQYIVNALAALGADQPGLSSAARIALAEKATAHPRVYEICQAELARQPAGVRDQMQAALAGVSRR